MSAFRIFLAAVFLLLFAGILYFAGYKNQFDPHHRRAIYEDGIYRGVFIDRGEIQVNVELELENGIVTEAGFRWLRADENYHLDAEQDPYKSVVEQYIEALAYLEGKNLKQHLQDLYQPEKIVTTEVDGYSAATIRSQKIISAIRDGLNRGIYNYD